MSGTGLLDLGEREAHVWLAWLRDCDSPALLDYYASLLDAQEQAQCARLAFPHLRHEYLLTRALCRTTLSRYAPVEPRQWNFKRNAYGRPEIDLPAAPRVRFNLSNARSLVACVVTREADAGIDVEETERGCEMLDIAEHYFAADELRALRDMPALEQPARFFQLWTLKEAYIKARGLGLSIPLQDFSFDLNNPAHIPIAFAPVWSDEAAHWQFIASRPSERHALAVALRRGAGPDYAIRVRAVVPAPDCWRDHSVW
jgi:4'-phosphopantetheinyl transferase